MDRILRRSSYQMVHSAPSTAQELEDKLEQVIVWHGLMHTSVFRSRTSQITQDIALLVQLSALHKWRLDVIFKYIDDRDLADDTPQDKDLSEIEFERVYTLARLSMMLCKDRKVRLDLLLMQLHRELDTIQDDILRCALSSRNERMATWYGESEGQAEGIEAMQAMRLRLLAEEAQIEATLRQMQGGASEACGLDKDFVLYLAAWVNVLLVSFYFTNVSNSSLDGMCSVFPFLHLLDILHTIWHPDVGSLREYVICHKDPDRWISRVANFAICTWSLCGVVLLFFEGVGASPFVEKNVTRFVASLTCLMVFTRSRNFARMFHTGVKAVQACRDILLAMVVIMCLFALTSRDLFADTTEDGVPVFDRFSKSMTTMFRLFIGEGWHSVMYAASDNTTGASKFFFMVYVFLVTMLFGQLLVGVIINLYQEVSQVTSSRVYDVLHHIYRNCSERERERIMEDLLEINWRLADIHAAIERITQGNIPKEQAMLEMNDYNNGSGVEYGMTESMSVADVTAEPAVIASGISVTTELSDLRIVSPIHHDMRTVGGDSDNRGEEDESDEARLSPALPQD